MFFTKFFLDERTKLSKEALDQHCEKETTCSIRFDCGLHDLCLDKRVQMTENVMSDVEVFTSYDGTPNNTLFERLSPHVYTFGGKETLKTLLATPIYDIKILKDRQNVITTLSNALQKDHMDDFKKLQDLEKDVHWLFEETDENIKLLYDMVYYRFFLLKPLNSNSHALTGVNLYQIFLSPAIGIVSPIVYFIAPFLILKYKFGDIINFSFFTYLKFMFNTFVKGGGITDMFLGGGGGGTGSKLFRWASFAFSLLFYFQGIFNSVEISKTVYRISKFLTHKAEKIITAIEIMKKLLDALWKNNMATLFVSGIESADDDKLQDFIDHVPPAQSFTPFSDFGKSLKFIRNIDKTCVRHLLSKIYMVDCLGGCVSILKSYKSVCLSDYKDQETPFVSIQQTWHPCLPEATTVKNNIDIDAHNIILTGPNAGGKSTFIKTMILNILLSQTLGIAFAERCMIRPFHIISTQINVPDMKGKESLFEAEMHRCKNTLELIKQEGCKLVIMDEIFNSTNPVEGISAAYAVAKKISEHKDTLLLFTTHFIYLTKLAKKTEGRFINYRMNVEKDETTMNIVFPYILQKGVSKQYVALELLKRNGFDADIIEEAISIKKRLC